MSRFMSGRVIWPSGAPVSKASVQGNTGLTIHVAALVPGGMRTRVVVVASSRTRMPPGSCAKAPQFAELSTLGRFDKCSSRRAVGTVMCALTHYGKGKMWSEFDLTYGVN